jgi:hypothetical protein
MLSNQDTIRQFLVTLLTGELAVLSGYPYIDMFDDVENIIESRPISAEGGSRVFENCRFYNFLGLQPTNLQEIN